MVPARRTTVRERQTGPTGTAARLRSPYEDPEIRISLKGEGAMRWFRGPRRRAPLGTHPKDLFLFFFWFSPG